MQGVGGAVTTVCKVVSDGVLDGICASPFSYPTGVNVIWDEVCVPAVAGCVRPCKVDACVPWWSCSRCKKWGVPYPCKCKWSPACASVDSLCWHPPSECNDVCATLPVDLEIKWTPFPSVCDIPIVGTAIETVKNAIAALLSLCPVLGAVVDALADIVSFDTVKQIAAGNIVSTATQSIADVVFAVIDSALPILDNKLMEVAALKARAPAGALMAVGTPIDLQAYFRFAVAMVGAATVPAAPDNPVVVELKNVLVGMFNGVKDGLVQGLKDYAIAQLVDPLAQTFDALLRWAKYLRGKLEAANDDALACYDALGLDVVGALQKAVSGLLALAEAPVASLPAVRSGITDALDSLGNLDGIVADYAKDLLGRLAKLDLPSLTDPIDWILSDRGPFGKLKLATQGLVAAVKAPSQLAAGLREVATELPSDALLLPDAAACSCEIDRAVRGVRSLMDELSDMFSSVSDDAFDFDVGSLDADFGFEGFSHWIPITLPTVDVGFEEKTFGHELLPAVSIVVPIPVMDVDLDGLSVNVPLPPGFIPWLRFEGLPTISIDVPAEPPLNETPCVDVIPELPPNCTGAGGTCGTAEACEAQSLGIVADALSCPSGGGVCCLGWDGDTTCGEGCTWSMVGDGECQGSCFDAGEGCAYDAADCIGVMGDGKLGLLECALGCTLSMLANGVCDSPCAVPACAMDAADCLSALPGPALPANGTGGPTEEPSWAPSGSWSQSPSGSPLNSPSQSPTGEPTGSPLSSPSQSPTGSPLNSPSQSPSHSPFEPPTMAPTTQPTHSPLEPPTMAPTTAPTQQPTYWYYSWYDYYGFDYGD